MPSSVVPQSTDSLLVIDVQRDFLPGGSLAVPEGDAVLPVINDLMRRFRDAGQPIFATRDWHPDGHCSFHEQGGPWPVHCVQRSAGAEFADELEMGDDVIVVSKDTEVDRNTYDGFEDTDLAEQLRSHKIGRIVVTGLATDYCVLNTVLAALRNGFEVVVVEDAIRAVNVKPDDGERAIERMRDAGAAILAAESA